MNNSHFLLFNISLIFIYFAFVNDRYKCLLGALYIFFIAFGLFYCIYLYKGVSELKTTDISKTLVHATKLLFKVIPPIFAFSVVYDYESPHLILTGILYLH